MSYLGRLNSLLTSTTSRYDSLRRNILSSSSEDDSNVTDPSCSHVSRVLRAYYTEKGLPLPDWLGPDPRTPSQPPSATARLGGSLRTGSLRGGLGDLWSEEGERASLRRAGGRRVRDRDTAAVGDSNSQQQTQQQGGAGLNVRPLPSQRAGSYQANPAFAQGGMQGRAGSPVPPGSSGSATGGAAERLKARLGRGGSGGGSGLGGWQGSGGGGGGGEGQGRRY